MTNKGIKAMVASQPPNQVGSVGLALLAAIDNPPNINPVKPLK